MTDPLLSKNPEAESETTGLPGLRVWRSVYLWVTAIFVFWVVALKMFERFFS